MATSCARFNLLESGIQASSSLYKPIINQQSYQQQLPQLHSSTEGVIPSIMSGYLTICTHCHGTHHQDSTATAGTSSLALYLLRAFNSGLHLLDPVSRLQFLFYIGNDALGPSCVLEPGHEACNQPPMAATGVSRYKLLPAAALLGRHAI